MSVATMDRSGINWRAVDHARQYYREQHGPHASSEHYQDWMLHEWGIVITHSRSYIDNNVKYTAFLLRFA